MIDDNTMLEIHVLGSPQFILSEQPATELRAAKSQAIVCYLALTKRPLSRTALCGLLWPDKSDQEARVNLRQSLHLVQKALPGVLDAQRETVVLAPDFPVTVDVAQFEKGVFAGDIDSLETAVSLYHGDFMAGFHLEDAYPFEEWLLLERERLRGLAVQALHDLTAHFVARRQTEQGMRYARLLLRLEPWLEEGHRALMRLLAWQGQYSAALKQYATCRKLLADELGVEPAPETAVLFERIRQLRTASRPLLPQDTFPLIDRETEQAALNGMLHDPQGRLVTLLGPGGMGKTRLMLAVAEQQVNLFLDGVHWVELAEVETGEGLITAVISQLGLQMNGTTPPRTQLLNYLRGKELLLLLDNFEQLAADGTALALIRELLRTAPQLVMMATSRVRLGLQQEQVYRLDSLPYPTGETPLANVADYPAVALFVETARWGRPDWVLAQGSGEETAVVQICQLVEGLPLGLKMAAALTQAQSSAAIAEALTHNLDWLSSEMADLPPRQRSLRATFDYSLRLLPAAEQDFFLQLSIFRGSFTREAVQAIVVVAGKTANPHLLARLVNHSLLSYDNSGDRYTIHAVVRQFAAEQRRAADDNAELSRRYAAYYLTFLAERQGALQGESPQMAVAEIGDELDNVQQAWRLGLAQQQFGLVLGGLHALSTFFQLNGRSPEAKEMLAVAAQQVAPYASDDAVAARLLAWLLLEQGRFFIRLSQYEKAIGVLEGSLPWAKQSRDEEAEGMALVFWGEVLQRQGAYQAAIDKLHLAKELTDWSRPNQVKGYTTFQLGIVYDYLRDYKHSFQFFEESLAVWEALGNGQRYLYTLNSLGAICNASQNRLKAQEYFTKALEVGERVGDSQAMSNIVNNLGNLYIAQQAYEEADKYLTQALFLARKNGNRHLEATVDLNLGALKQLQNQNQVARTFVRQAMVIAEDIEFSWLWMKALETYGRIVYEVGHIQEARSYFEKTLSLKSKVINLPSEYEAWLGLAQISHQEGDYEQEHELLLEAFRLASGLESIERQEKIQALLEQCQVKFAKN